MSGAVTGLEGMLATRILAGRNDEHEPEASAGTVADELASAYIEANVEARKMALRGQRLHGRAVVVTTTSKDWGTSTSTQISAAGSLSLSTRIAAAELDLMTSAMTQVTGGTPTLRYLEAVQGVVNPTLTALHQLAHATMNAEEQLVHAMLQNVPAALIGAPDKKDSDKAAWFDEARQELAETLEGEGSPDSEKREMLSDWATNALEHAAKVGVDAPAIDIDHQGNLHLFWKKGSEGLLVVIRTDGTIHFFGNSNGESFRSDYPINGKTWHSHLSFYLQPLRSDAAA
jgi:hypothetical protein